MCMLVATSAFRTILILIILWLVLRMWIRMQQTSKPGSGPARTEDQRPRPKGEVRIERTMPDKPGTFSRDIEDADFEEIK
jgi:hypothetical protein